MSTITVPVSSILGMGTGAASNTPVGTPSTGTGAQINTPVGTSGTWIGVGKPVFAVKPGGGAIHLYPGLRNSLTGQVVTNQDYLYFLEFGKLPPRYGTTPPEKPKAPRPSRGGGSAGGAGGGGGGGSLPLVDFSGSGSERVTQLQAALAGPRATDLAGLDGRLTTTAQAALIDGLDLLEITPELIAYLDPDATVNFLIYDDGQGTVQYIEALYLTATALALFSTTSSMNFPTALQYLSAGFRIARSGWGTDGVPDYWLLERNGVRLIGTDGAWVVVTSESGADAPNLTAEDLLAGDWIVQGATVSFPVQPDLAAV